MVHDLEHLGLQHFLFFGSMPQSPMPAIDELPASKSPGRRTAAGEQKVREHYRDVKVRTFEGPLSAAGLFDKLFP